MAFRRSAPSRARSFKRRSFSRNRTHQPKRTGHWQRANLRIDSRNVVDEVGANVNTVLVLGQIANHLATDGDTAGRAYTNQVKFLEIGGLVFDWQLQLSDLASDFTTPPATDIWAIDNQIILVSDRMDTGGFPAAIDVNWFSSTTPIPVAGATASDDEDGDFPTRVHWRHARNIVGGYGQFPDVTGNFTPSNTVVSLQGSANLRLRLALDDEHVLAMHFASVLTDLGSTIVAAEVRLTLVGSMYYRVRVN